MNAKYCIEKLTDRNCMVWATQVRLVLESKGLWKYVEGTALSDRTKPEKAHRETRQCLAEIILNIDNKFVAAVKN